MKSVTVYTDGACSGNPGPGGWAAILTYNGHEKELSAVIAALDALKEKCSVTLYTDSQYIERAINEHWLDSWKKRGWRRKDGPVKNLELWQELDRLLRAHEVSVHWVKGHADNEMNNRCDALAVKRRDEYASGGS